jgi:hypothetical protein
LGPKPELFFELARAFPAVDFIAVGGAQDKERDRELRAVAAGIPNLQVTGIIDQFRSGELHEVLSKSWVLVNTSPREGFQYFSRAARCHGSGSVPRRSGVASGRSGLGSISGDRWKRWGRGCSVKRVFSSTWPWTLRDHTSGC